MQTFPFPIRRRPFIVAGPCGVESEESIFSVAEKLSHTGIDLLRGGIWKPRTRPDSFQGIGTTGLEWLKSAGKKYNLPVAVEVASPLHVAKALEARIDVLWIGARTTVNPFLVQEIADSLNGVDIQVMVKNPINPELDLWIGAFERLNRAGITKLIAIHRGFSQASSSKYRNAPHWQIPIELKRRCPELPLVCDPSHISGRAEFIGEISQYAMDLNYEGLMIETHVDPARALSDREQQVTPDDLKKILDNIVIRQKKVSDLISLNMLENLRARIDEIDKKIISDMSERMSVAREIGQYKKENNLTVLQVERWNAILEMCMQSGLIRELDEQFIRQLYALIHDESIRQQNEVMNGIGRALI